MGQTLCRTPELVRLAEQRPRPRQQGRPRRREQHRAPVAVEEPGAQIAFQGLDLLGQRGPGDPQPLGGPGEAQLLGDRDEVAQLA
jgi:hypothetical protein